ncbi:Rne/Rng family ribonuclease [Neoehrlichia mikurensis]|uniref:Rne/Rng family ribonuclease n=1 Tax=Neoehrlichia mikurensis TaxID=89586 RepID=A0A9Q9BSP6_9RICK|nr:Rne/Rng family ribonuclease [Neoehrlichia mikurensis]QXK91842.1 Rne/Rng family ribonuclease [Neoehrlichia mikurensis]QXK93055.1 Rne/Rng family ribonuclease [Neoehrlichia mikurensis]QXK93533.1 Rne/Rng family ribonuclease [Neoehrlichia mikurensis]UTO55512.1 Rne/Rng family ribonuclease [Neoehrlichia mikurensis]UTO56433.1 Rne/Rng family ribonuclease [Neoehrlichia mikurensis]
MSNHGKRILIDAVCPDEVRVAVLSNGQIIEFDQEIRNKRRLKGSIYYAIVKRIEPSLQAVFIEYGISKHGFLPFSEISVEYYHISQCEKENLLQLMYNEDQDFAKDVVRNDDKLESVYGDNDQYEGSIDIDGNNIIDDKISCHKKEMNLRGNKSRALFYKMYKVQDVIKVDQKIMVQIIKEERGNKCATFSTFINLIGRYCIFMPNSGKKNSGISRRIDDANDRKNLKNLLNTIKLPKESGVIIRTAGQHRNQKEIEQDLLYLQSIWKNIYNNCSNVNPPALLYIEGDIIKRTLRDFCDESVQDVIVSGNEAYEIAKECVKFMFRNKLRLKLYKGSIPIFTYYKVDSQVIDLYSNKVNLPSGGYLIITSTEALVSIDVNSGRMTGEDSIEETAYKTNIEAVKEIAKQVNLRGLSGLIVIDFIDMLKYRYCRVVESELKEAFKYDRAKVQFGCISAFGLMEISRQRVKQSIFEANTIQCTHCNGVGRVRSLESISADILREIRYSANKHRNKSININVVTNEQMISYIFNNKRNHVYDIEKEFNVIIKLSVNRVFNISDFSLSIEKGCEKDVYSEDVVNLFTVNYKNTKIIASVEKDRDMNHNVKNNHVDTWSRKWLRKIFYAS